MFLLPSNPLRVPSAGPPRPARPLRPWRLPLAFFVGGLLLALVPPRWVRAAGAQPAASPAPAADVRGALQEMSELETRIEQAQRLQLEQQRRLVEASRSLQSVDSVLQRKNGLNKEGEQFLKAYGQQARAGLDAIEEQLVTRRQAVESARAGLNLAGAALLAEGASASSTAPGLLTLALLQGAQRDRARIASSQIQDLEARRVEVTGKSEHAETSARYQSTFSEYSLNQLRARHEALARQVAQVEAQADAQSQTVRQLASRRGQLKDLVASLAAQEVARTPAATPAPPPAQTPRGGPRPHPALPSVNGAGLTPTPPPSVPAATPPAAPVVPAATPTLATAALAEVPYEEGGAPVASLVPAAEDKDQTDSGGTRFLFWRARPVGVHALAPGRILFSAPFAGYRHLLIVDHGGGWRSLYGNMIQCSVSTGDAVQAGQALGQYQAVEGTRAEPLWFEVRQGVQAVAPETWPALTGPWQGRLLGLLATPAGG